MQKCTFIYLAYNIILHIPLINNRKVKFYRDLKFRVSKTIGKYLFYVMSKVFDI